MVILPTKRRDLFTGLRKPARGISFRNGQYTPSSTSFEIEIKCHTILHKMHSVSRFRGLDSIHYCKIVVYVETIRTFTFDMNARYMGNSN